MKTRCIIMAVLAWAFHLSADPTNNIPLKIGTADAINFYGKQMTVTGEVVQVINYENIIYLNMDKPYPDAPFALMVYPRDSLKFGHLADLIGKNVEATGKIGGHPTWPDIVLEKTNQLKVLPSDTSQ